MLDEQAFARPPGRDERRIAVRTHLSGLLFFTLIPMLVPLVVWRRQRTRSRWLARQAREALNFQITLWLGVLLSIPLVFVMIGWITLLLVFVLGLVLPLAAAQACANGGYYRYPLILRLVR